MPLFAIPEAEYFVRSYSGSAGKAQGSFRDLCRNVTPGRTFSEGKQDFAELRDCSLREVERLLFLAICHYRRSLNLLTPGTASWAHVTLYYGAFFAASSLLGLFGTWKLRNNKVLDVVTGTPGSQELAVRTINLTHKGSHQEFWELFYAATPPLLPWISHTLRYALQPVSGDVTWLISRRNETNYDAFAAHSIMTQFQKSFRRTKVPASLPGVLSTQFSITEALVQIAVSFAKQCGLCTDALNNLDPPGNRRVKVQRLILDERLPALNRLVKRRVLLG